MKLLAAFIKNYMLNYITHIKILFKELDPGSNKGCQELLNKFVTYVTNF